MKSMLHPMRYCGILDATRGGSPADMARLFEAVKVVREEDLMAQVPVKTASLEAGPRELGLCFGQLVSRIVRGLKTLSDEFACWWGIGRLTFHQ